VSARAGIPLPRPTELSRPHWEGCLAGELRFQRCRGCGEAIFIPQPVCGTCFGSDLAWERSSGRGTVYSHTVVHRPPLPAFETPYAVIVVELEEGFFMLSNLVDCDPTSVRIGLSVEVCFRRMSDDIALPCFRPAEA
jgi:uncharacterized OB-fold protein